MTTGSKTSNRRRTANQSARRKLVATSHARRRSPVEPQWYECLRPKARRRKREARRWLDVLSVHTTNGRPRDRRRGQPLRSVFEISAIFCTELQALEARDPDLYNAVRKVMFDDSARNLDISIEEWRRGAHRSVERLGRLRRVLPAGRGPGALKAALRYTEGSGRRRNSPHAEVAERQTR